ncbi:hypothetical protein H0H81_003974 [Sphagnurus paluster]|uniref:F-box domain-containing protein n=1 Tax=Sphagnurus paluster TaxID=117069 RepID=A0A9P7KJJ7_9AGAR|nr:hypothetical protein H0H81_003974 [Sphagnurus paluster]
MAKSNHAESPESRSHIQIPSDIWVYIAQFVPSKSLCNLYSLNSIFLHLALNERYKALDFTDCQCDERTVHFLKHISDSNISSRVRQLRVDSQWFDPESHIRFTLVARFQALMRSALLLGPWRAASFGFIRSKYRKRRKAIDTLTASLVAQFSNLTTFIIVPRHSERYYPLGFSLLFTKSYATFGSTLRQLTIKVRLNGVTALLPSDPTTLASLQEFTLQLFPDQEDYVFNTQILIKTVSPFIQQIASKLTKFNLLSSAHADHSSIFDALGDTPNLNIFSLGLLFHATALQDPSSLVQFLSRNADALKHVRLQPLGFETSFAIPHNIDPADRCLTSWFKDNASDTRVFSNLQTLAIMPYHSAPAASPITACLLIDRSRDTLTSLFLGERYLSLVELANIVLSFTHRPADRRLKVLHVNLVSLNPQLFDLLADKIRSLEDLSLNFRHIFKNCHEEGGSFEYIYYDKIGHKNIGAFLAEMEKRTYPLWKLISLSFNIGSCVSDYATKHIIEDLKFSIPSVRLIYQMHLASELLEMFN